MQWIHVKYLLIHTGISLILVHRFQAVRCQFNFFYLQLFISFISRNSFSKIGEPFHRRILINAKKNKKKENIVASVIFNIF